MTARAAKKVVAHASSVWAKELDRFSRELKRKEEKEVRRRWREEFGLVYTRQYTVQAHFKRLPNRKLRATPVAATA